MKILLVEDADERIKWFSQRTIGHVLHVAKNAPDAIEFLKNFEYDLIYLDHDLEDIHYAAQNQAHERTGNDVVIWLAQNPESQCAASFVIHSLNPYGSQKMLEGLKFQGREVVRTSYLELMKIND